MHSSGRRLWSAAAPTWLLAATLLAGCGGGGGGGGEGAPTAAPAPRSAASAPTTLSTPAVPLIVLSSDASDRIGGGQTYRYDLSSASIQLRTSGSHVRIEVQGREQWSGEFLLPGNTLELTPGTYPALVRYPFQAPGQGAMSWSGQGRGCNTLSATVVVQTARYERGRLRALEMSFEQRCDGSAGVLRGEIRIGADSMAGVTGLQNPLPEQPVVRLDSETGDYVGGGGRYGYDHRSARFRVSATAGLLQVNVDGDEAWAGWFQLPGGFTRLSPGRHENVASWPSQATGAPGLLWTGEGRACSGRLGVIDIRSVRYAGDELRAIDMSFVQQCEGGPAALRGEISWDADLPSAPPAPVVPAPADLWAAPANIAGRPGNAMYVTSEPGEYVGQGWTWLVGAAAGGDTPAPPEAQGTVRVAITESAGLLRVVLTGDVSWAGEFKAMDGLPFLQAGYYGVVKRYPLHNPARGGMNWTMESRGCSRLSGWFVVDQISYTAGRLSSVELRFTQYCDSTLRPLRGWIRWNLGSATTG